MGTRATLIASLAVLACGLAWLSFASAQATFAGQLLAPTLLIGAGIGGAFVTTTQLAMDGVDLADAGLAGGLLNTSQQIGGALGLAVLAAIATTRTDGLARAGASVPVALTGGFSWLFISAAVLALLGAGAAALSRNPHR